MGGAAGSTLILPNTHKINREVFHKTPNCNEVFHENLKILVIVISLRDFLQSLKNILLYRNFLYYYGDVFETSNSDEVLHETS